MNKIKICALAVAVLAGAAVPSGAKADSLVISYTISSGRSVRVHPAPVFHARPLPPPRRVFFGPKRHHHRFHRGAHRHHW